ncbi:MAG: hypothetical protein COB36_10725 [Alphaproteobacteria bacterium]|nr:MAG: hypothetical protein COB36_10725 [Alphaproteobacteria bacterium]
MSLSQMQVFNDFAYLTYTETLRQQIELFNAASGGSLVLSSVANTGDFSEEAFYKKLSTVTRRRDPYATGVVAPVSLTQDNHVAVKVAGGTPPIAFDPAQFAWIQKSPEEAGIVIGEQLSKGILADQVNSSVAALQAALANTAAVNYDATAGTLTLNALNRGAAMFGDRAMDIKTWVIHSTPMHDLFDTALTNGNDLFKFGDVAIIQDGFGRRFVMTDSPSLFNATASPDQYSTLGLSEGAAIVEDNGDLYTNIEESNGDENINRTFQAEYSFNLKLKGFAWDKASGGKAPNDAEIATGSNWDQVATDAKDLAGVVVTSQ